MVKASRFTMLHLEPLLSTILPAPSPALTVCLSEIHSRRWNSLREICATGTEPLRVMVEPRPNMSPRMRSSASWPVTALRKVAVILVPTGVSRDPVQV